MAGEVILEKIKSSEKIVRQIEAENILVFVVDRAIKKSQVKAEVELLFDVEVAKVRTHTLKNKKVATYPKHRRITPYKIIKHHDNLIFSINELRVNLLLCKK